MINNLSSKAFPKRFLLSAAVLSLLWLIGYELILKPQGQPDIYLTGITASAGQTILNLIGYTTAIELIDHERVLLYHGQEVLSIAHNCNGLIIFALFTGLLLLMPGKVVYKLCYIPAGILLLFILNASRVAVLTLTQLHHPDWLDFNHKYTFSIIIYAVVFLLWMGWVKILKSTSGNKWPKRKLQVS